jgi:hypothetical protein
MRCSCGCGRKLTWRELRANARAGTARDLVATMEALAFETDPDEYRRAFLFEGVSWRNQYTRVAHGELTREQIRPEAAWRTWLSGARPAVRRASREPAHAPPPSPSREHVRDAGRSTDPVVDKPRPAVNVASSEDLARRIREVVGGRDGVTEGTTFGCVAWMVNGNVACGALGDKLLVRVDRCDCERILAEAHVQPMKRGARIMPGFVTVDVDATADDAELARWIDAGTGYAAWLSPKATPPSTRSANRPMSPSPSSGGSAKRSAANAGQPRRA